MSERSKNSGSNLNSHGMVVGVMNCYSSHKPGQGLSSREKIQAYSIFNIEEDSEYKCMKHPKAILTRRVALMYSQSVTELKNHLVSCLYHQRNFAAYSTKISEKKISVNNATATWHIFSGHIRIKPK